MTSLDGGYAHSEDWDQFWGANLAARFSSEGWSKRRMVRVLDRYVQPGMAVLDAGCGSGYFSAYFLGKGCETFALDFSAEALDATRERTAAQCSAYLCEDLLDRQLAARLTGAFDLIFSDGLLEHFSLSEQSTILSGFVRMKRPQGYIATFVPNLFSWWTLVRPLFMPHIRERPFTLGRLRALHQRHNLRCIESGGINVLPIACSPDRYLGRWVGMLLYFVGR
jgi:cyclopropane fatty-acyl-phospholipid synthase-like methyltransferase